MARIITSAVLLQPLVVVGGGGTNVEPRHPLEQHTDVVGNTYMTYVRPHANVSGPGIITTEPRIESQLLKRTFSSVPVVLRSELTEEYEELGNALTEMAQMGEGDDWKIDTVVYQVACLVAAELSAQSYPAPRIFTHGPKSVVFNWSQEPNNLYLTISSDFVSALASTPERITRRVEFSTKQLHDPTLIINGLLSVPSERAVIARGRAASQVEDSIE